MNNLINQCESCVFIFLGPVICYDPLANGDCANFQKQTGIICLKQNGDKIAYRFTDDDFSMLDGEPWYYIDFSWTGIVKGHRINCYGMRCHSKYGNLINHQTYIRWGGDDRLKEKLSQEVADRIIFLWEGIGKIVIQYLIREYYEYGRVKEEK